MLMRYLQNLLADYRERVATKPTLVIQRDCRGCMAHDIHVHRVGVVKGYSYRRYPGDAAWRQPWKMLIVWFPGHHEDVERPWGELYGSSQNPPGIFVLIPEGRCFPRGGHERDRLVLHEDK